LDEKLSARLDELLDEVTTLSPNNLQDWWEIQQVVLNRIYDEGYSVSIEEFVERFKEWGMDPLDIKELRRRLRRTFGG